MEAKPRIVLTLDGYGPAVVNGHRQTTLIEQNVSKGYHSSANSPASPLRTLREIDHRFSTNHHINLVGQNTLQLIMYKEQNLGDLSRYAIFPIPLSQRGAFSTIQYCVSDGAQRPSHCIYTILTTRDAYSKIFSFCLQHPNQAHALFETLAEQTFPGKEAFQRYREHGSIVYLNLGCQDVSRRPIVKTY